jgi:hypothetical protein
LRKYPSPVPPPPVGALGGEGYVLACCALQWPPSVMYLFCRQSKVVKRRGLVAVPSLDVTL